MDNKKITDNENRRQQHEHQQDTGVEPAAARPVPPEHVGEEHKQNRSEDQSGE